MDIWGEFSHYQIIFLKCLPYDDLDNFVIEHLKERKKMDLHSESFISSYVYIDKKFRIS